MLILEVTGTDVRVLKYSIAGDHSQYEQILMSIFKRLTWTYDVLIL